MQRCLDDTGSLAALDLVPAQVAVLARDGRIEFVNTGWKTFAESNAYRGNTFVGQNYLGVCRAAEGVERLQALEVAGGVEDVLAGRRPMFETIYPCHSPEDSRWFKAIVAEAGDCVIVTHVDFSAEYQRFRRTARISENAKLVHDLRSPLNAILVFAELGPEVLDHGVASAKARGYFQHIGEAGHRMLDLVDGILEMTDVAVEDGTARCDPVDLSGLLAGLGAEMEPVAGRENIAMEIVVPDGLVLLGERDKLWKIFENLLSNAIKYNRTGGTVSVSAIRNGAAGIEVRVRDAGIGMDPRRIDSIFEPFVRLDDPEARTRKGSGLGLSIVKGLVDRHDGRISVATEPSVGSEFTVIFPTWRVAIPLS